MNKTGKMKSLILLIFFAMAGFLSVWAKNEVIISTRNNSLVLIAEEGKELLFGYFGKKVSSEHIPQLYAAGLIENVAAYPVFGRNCISENAMLVQHPNGSLSLELVVAGIEQQTNRTTLVLKDRFYPFEVRMNYVAHMESDVIEMWAEVVNHARKKVVLKRFDSAFLPLRMGDVWISHLHGAWASEANVTTEPLRAGMKVIKNKDGVRNSLNDHAEVMLSLDGCPKDNSGRVIGAALCWGGNYKFRVDTDDNRYHRFFAGINEEASEYQLEAGETFATPKLAVTFSREGLGGVSRNFHRWARNEQIHAGNKVRDILLNSWEGVYFKVREAEMKKMMNDISSLGGELFVMDDGWFGEKYPRVGDHAGLGDWVTDKNKLPDGVNGLLHTAKQHGIKFGIWIEPEMVCKQSELYEKHPDWVIHQPDRSIAYGRGGGQMVLDLSNPEVQDFVFGVVDRLMTQYPELAYIKWDANMTLANYGSSYLSKEKQSHLYIDYHRGFRKIVERIRLKYPDLVMQACASGGGRANYGVLAGFDEFWVSDNTDALQRIYMQWGTSYFFPSIAMASHVSASPNHQTGRRVPLKFRFDVAMMGRLGMEMQPSSMTEQEQVFSKKAIETYKHIRPIVQLGDLYRLISPYDNKGVASLMYVAPEKEHAVFFGYKLVHFINQQIPRFRMAGLDPMKNYRFTELNLPIGEEPCSLHGKVISGQILMENGVEISLRNEYASRVFELSVE